MAKDESGSRSHWLSAYPFSGVTRGLDPRVHPLRKTRFAKKMDCIGTRACPSSALLRAASRVNPTCGVKPGNDGGETVAAILRPFEREPLLVMAKDE